MLVMKLYRHILLAGFLVACGSQGNKDRTDSMQPTISAEEKEQVADPPQSVINIDEMTMQELYLLYISPNPQREGVSPSFGGGWGEASKRMAQLQQTNYIRTDDDISANIMNIINIFQFREIIRQEVMDDLAVDNYAIVPDSLLQLFQVYQRNDSLQIPNFVTVDLMAQLSFIFESYLLRTLEEKYFVPMLTELCLVLYNASIDQAAKTTSENVKDLANFNAAFFVVTYNLLTGKSLNISGDYHTMVEEELAYIAQQENRRSALLNTRANFDYSVFKTYGHYTRTADLRRYFRAWKWLQLAPYCSDNKTQQQRAVLLALALQTAKTKSGASAMDVYVRLAGAMNWFVGQPSGCSVLDVSQLLKKERITTVTAALDAKFLAKLTAMIRTASTAGNAFVTKYPAACSNGIYFMPQPVYADEGVSSCNKRLECVLATQQMPPNSPVFAQKQAWNRKKLETLSALKLKMKHNVLLYGVIPDHSEPLPTPSPTDTIFSQPLTLGYVEPALPFWTKLREWVELTDKVLKNHQLTCDTLVAISERMHRYVALMEDAVQRQLNNERLPDETYRFIAHICDSIQQFTMSMIEPKIDRWEWTAGTDRSAAVFEKIYQRNETQNPSDDVLYAATGNINQIYVIVEIDGYLYLTKGATFSYHEFFMPPEKTLKDEDWQEMRRKLFP